MLNKNVIEVLQSVNNMTNSVILKYPKTVAVSEAQDMLMCIDISKLDSDEFPDLPLKDSLSDLLNLIKLFPDERNITVEGNTINISDDDTSSSYILDNAALMEAQNADESHFTKTEQVPTVSEFDITSDDIKKIKAGSGVFKDLSEVIFTSQDGDMSISLGATNKFNAKSNTFSVIKPSVSTKEFYVKIPVDNFKLLPESDYTVQVKYKSERNAYRILMLNKTLDDFKILLTVKV